MVDTDTVISVVSPNSYHHGSSTAKKTLNENKLNKGEVVKMTADSPCNKKIQCNKLFKQAH